MNTKFLKSIEMFIIWSLVIDVMFEIRAGVRFAILHVYNERVKLNCTKVVPKYRSKRY